MRRFIASAVSAVALVGATASPAAAAITVGQSGTSSSGNCTSGLAQLSTTSAPPSYVIPSDGVITSFSAASDTGANHTELLVLRFVSPLTYNVVAESPPETFTATFQTFPVRIPVQAGEMIGNYGKACAIPTNDSNDVFSSFSSPTEPPLGSNQVFGGPTPKFRINLSAQLEPDADRDGYGDETQDACPTDASTQGPCPLTPAATPTAAATGERAAALKKCGKKHGTARKKCKKRANLLPV